MLGVSNACGNTSRSSVGIPYFVGIAPRRRVSFTPIEDTNKVVVINNTADCVDDVDELIYRVHLSSIRWTVKVSTCANRC